MLACLVAALVATQIPQGEPVDAPVFEDTVGGVALARPWDDWVFEPARSRGMTTVILHPRNGSLSSQLYGSLVVTTLNRSVPLGRLADERVFQSWQPTLGPTFQVLARDSLSVLGLPAVHVVMSGAIARAELDVEEYLIARGGDLIVLQFRYPRALPRDSIALGYERAFAGLRIRGAPGAEAVVAVNPPAPAAAPPVSAPPLTAPPAPPLVPGYAAEMWALLGGSPWRVERIEARFRLSEIGARPEIETRLDLVNDGLPPVDQVPLWIPRAATLDSVRIANGRIFNGGDVAPLARVPLGDTVVFQDRASVTVYYHGAPLAGMTPQSGDWLPAVQSPFDSLGRPRPLALPRVSLTFDVPASVAAVATGHLTADLTTEARRRETWIAEGVTAARPAFVIGPFAFTSRTAGRLALGIWATSTGSNAADSCARLVAAAWAFNARAFGPVGAPEVSVVVGTATTRGFPGLLVLSADAARSQTAVLEEMSRTWWGGSVRGAGAGASLIDGGLPAWIARAATGDRPTGTPNSAVAAIEGLRSAVGEPRFRELMRTLAVEHRGGSVSVDDVAQLFGEAGAAALRSFVLGN